MYLRGNVTSPQGEVVRIHRVQLVVHFGNVVHQEKLLERVESWVGTRVELKRREGENARHLPFGDPDLLLSSPEKVGLLRSSRAVGIKGGHVIVRAATLVLGAVAALRKALITADVATLAKELVSL